MASNNSNGSFVRWQSITIAQLTYATNLILTFTVATLGFMLSLLLRSDYKLCLWQKSIYIASLFFISMSIGLGIWLVINRLRDFRLTAKIAQLRENGNNHDEIELYRVISNKLGETTWILFWWQVGTFSVSILFTIITLLSTISHKIM